MYIMGHDCVSLESFLLFLLCTFQYTIVTNSGRHINIIISISCAKAPATLFIVKAQL